MLSVIGSIVDHRAKLPAVSIRALLADLAAAMLTAGLTELPEAAEDADTRSGRRILQIRSAAY